MHSKTRVSTGLLLLIVSAFAATTLGQPIDARYRLIPKDRPIYDIRVRAELPDWVEITDSYLVFNPISIDPGNGQMTVTFNSGTYRQQTQKEGSTKETSAPATPGFLSVPDPSGPQFVLSPGGKILHSDPGADRAQLSYSLGAAWQALLPPLPPEDKKTWSTGGETTLYSQVSKESQHGPFGHDTDTTRVEQPADAKTSYTVDSNKDGLLTVNFEDSLTSLAKVDGKPAIDRHGTGSYIFDTHAGLVQKLKMDVVVEQNQKNVSIKIPVTLTARLITGDERAKLLADSAAESHAPSQSNATQTEHRSNPHQVPLNGHKTAMVGGTGGGEFVNVDPDQRPVVGFHIRIGTWGGKKILSDCDPLYDRTAQTSDPNQVDVVAKDGYIVGGVIVSGTEYANGIQVIFVKFRNNKIDSTVNYTSPLYGESMPSKTRLDGKGQKIIGTFGRKGMNMDGFGLVVASPIPPK